MAFLKQNNKRAEESKKAFGLLPDGEYEIMATEGKWHAEENDQTKTPKANFTFIVRSDVEQEGKGRKIFHDFYVSRDPEKVETSLGFIERFNMDLGVPDGVEFESQQQWINYVLGKPIRAKIGKRTYNGKDYNIIKEFDSTQYATVNQQVAAQSQGQNAGTEIPTGGAGYTKVNNDPFANGSGQIDISDDDLPF